MNKKQRLVLAIFVPVILFFISLMIANSIGVKVTGHMTGVEYHPTASPGKKFTFSGEVGHYDTYTYNPFDWGKTWYIWFLFWIITFIFEYKLFADKKVLRSTRGKE